MICPICKKEFTDRKYRPFCSKRCADIDLGNWFSEKYTVEAVEIDEQDLEQLAEEMTTEKDDCQSS